MQPSGLQSTGEIELLRQHDRFQRAADRAEKLIARLAALVRDQSGMADELSGSVSPSIQDAASTATIQAQSAISVKQSQTHLADERRVDIYEKAQFIRQRANVLCSNSHLLCQESQFLIEQADIIVHELQRGGG